MLVMGMVGVVIERFAYRPLRHAPRLAPLITAIGVSFILQNIIQAIFRPSPISVPQIFPRTKLDMLGGSIGVLNMFMVVVAIVLMVALQLFVSRPAWARHALDGAGPRGGRADGRGHQPDDRHHVLHRRRPGRVGRRHPGLYFGSIQYNLGFFAGLKAFTAAVLGGIGNTTGAAIGGFVIAFIEVFAAQIGYSRWSEVAVFTVLILVLVFRPSGILGQALGERA